MSEMSIAEKTDEILKQIRLLNYRTDLSAAIADFSTNTAPCRGTLSTLAVRPEWAVEIYVYSGMEI